MAIVSIIVPAYNASKTINRCIDSILDQTLEDIEIIVINDGSKDDTLICLSKYKDDRLKIYTNENQGALLSRIYGVKVATGDYVMFVDSDDWIEKDMVQNMVMQSNNFTIDFIMSGLIMESNKIKYSKINKTEIYGNKNIRLSLVDSFMNESINGPCCKLIKRNLFENINLQFLDNICLQEDLIMNIELLKHVQSYATVDNCYYHYIYNSNSITHKYIENKFLMTSFAYKKIEEYFEGYLDDIDINKIKWLYFKNFYSAIVDLHLPNDKSILDKYNIIKEYINSKEMKNQLNKVCEKKFDIYKSSLIKIIRLNNVCILYILSILLFLCKYKFRFSKSWD